MDKKFNQILSALDELPDISSFGKLKIFHLIILKTIKKNSSIDVKDMVSHPQLSSISQAQRYRYIDDLLTQNFIKYKSKGVLSLA